MRRRPRSETLPQRPNIKNEFEAMSFSTAFNSPTWNQYLGTLDRPLPLTMKISHEVKDLAADSPIKLTREEVDLDEEVVLTELQDYLFCEEGVSFGEHQPPHPGSVLWLLVGSRPSEEVAVDLCLSPTTVRKIMVGEVGISENLAHRLSNAFGTSARFWLELQTSYSRWVSSQQR